MKNNISRQDIANFLNTCFTSNSSHLCGFKYVISAIATQKPNNLYGGVAEEYSMDYRKIERSIRYYFSHVENNMGSKKFKSLLNLKDNDKLSNKNIIGQLTIMLNK